MSFLVSFAHHPPPPPPFSSKQCVCVGGGGGTNQNDLYKPKMYTSLICLPPPPPFIFLSLFLSPPPPPPATCLSVDHVSRVWQASKTAAARHSRLAQPSIGRDARAQGVTEHIHADPSVTGQNKNLSRNKPERTRKPDWHQPVPSSCHPSSHCLDWRARLDGRGDGRWTFVRSVLFRVHRDRTGCLGCPSTSTFTQLLMDVHPPQLSHSYWWTSIHLNFHTAIDGRPSTSTFTQLLMDVHPPQLSHSYWWTSIHLDFHTVLELWVLKTKINVHPPRLPHSSWAVGVEDKDKCPSTSTFTQFLSCGCWRQR